MRAILTGSATMFLCGLWHGAGWQYVGFGVLMSSSILVSRFWSNWVPEGTRLRRTVTYLGPAILWWFLFVNWIVFRAVSWDDCMEMFAAFLFFQSPGTQRVPTEWLALFVAFFAVHTALRYGLDRRLEQVSDWSYATLYGVAAASCLLTMATNYQPFIYFQF